MTPTEVNVDTLGTYIPGELVTFSLLRNTIGPITLSAKNVTRTYANPTTMTAYKCIIAVSDADPNMFLVRSVDTTTVEAPLPIQLASFTATLLNQSRVRLDWVTMSEVNNYGFEIQKSDTTQQHYQTIPNSFIPGHGTTNEPQYYSYIDTTVTVGAWYYRLKQIDLDGAIHYSDGVRVNTLTDVEEDEIPTVFSLSQNYPNPWNPSTTIRYGVPHTSFVTLTVYNTLGQQVAQLVNEQQQEGYHDVVFRSDGLTSGVYFYRIQTGDFMQTKKLLLLK